ncbi:MAG: Gfo/Idh/MocA family oxidoreductase, partial [Spirochaetaceae bacterium]|nr:Gfo/Idh/MocA family oxidoreductase [Spirochaetaceae bacterium]
MQRPIRLGLIGCGGIVRISHAPGYQAIPDLVRVSAVADPVSDNLLQMGETLAVPPERRYADHREMLEHAELDAVTIATPHHLHAGHAMDAAAAGVAVISEKPMATSIEQAREVLAAVERHGVPYAVVHNFLFAQGSERARALLADGATGTPFFGRAKSLFNKTDDRADPNREWRASRAAGGGAINDTAYHEIYLLETLVGAPVRYV